MSFAPPPPFAAAAAAHVHADPQACELELELLMVATSRGRANTKTRRAKEKKSKREKKKSKREVLDVIDTWTGSRICLGVCTGTCAWHRVEARGLHQAKNGVSKRASAGGKRTGKRRINGAETDAGEGLMGVTTASEGPTGVCIFPHFFERFSFVIFELPPRPCVVGVVVACRVTSQVVGKR